MKELNKADVLLGLQWGDEGKGKIVDVLTPHYKMVARFQGGPNAGHSLVFENKKYILHTIPSGIFHRGCINVVGNGVVVDPFIFSRELDQLNMPLEELKESLFFCSKAHLILPSHRLLDAAFENKKGKLKIGSTLKGIGPAYTDKVARSGIRLADASDPGFNERYKQLKAEHMLLAASLGFSVEELILDGLDFETYEKAWFKGLDRLLSIPQVQSELFVNEALDKGARVLAEGAQGTLLDIDFGSYPFVTSSNTITAGACVGLGLAPSRIGEVFGVFKAYCTRVGSGPFPTELNDADGEHLRNMGQEYGSTTGRPRRCGWLDLPALKYAVMINGVSRLIMTKVDVLNQLPRFKVCVAYEVNGQHSTMMPPSARLAETTPVYTELEGWQCDLDKVESFEQLPSNLLNYVSLIEEFIGIRVDIISVGPDRKQTMFRQGAGILERLSIKL
ncbi:MAG: adenylosuccinate synthase [Bacteroidales bacterium]|nr:adenylosuccinate synthase [Bacteroidales bacterium]